MIIVMIFPLLFLVRFFPQLEHCVCDDIPSDLPPKSNQIN